MKAYGWSRLALGVLTVLGLSGAGLRGEALGVSCGDVIGPNASVALTSDLTCSTSPALKVVGPAELDLGFQTVRCADAQGAPALARVGIEVTGRGAHVHGGEVRGCDYGVDVGGVRVGNDRIGEHKIENVLTRDGSIGFSCNSDRNRFEGNVSLDEDWGFRLQGERNRLEDNYAQGIPGASSYGFLIEVDKARVIGNTARGFHRGFDFAAGEIRVESNVAEDNETGFDITANKSTFAGNTAVGNGIGFDVYYGDRLEFHRNRAEDNDTGFLTGDDSKDALFRHNTAVGNGFGFADHGFHTAFRFNTAVDNDLGIYVFTDAAQTIVYDNRVTSNTSHGIALSGEAAIVSKNRVEKNGEIGIWVTQDLQSRVVYNTSSGNGAFDMKDIVAGCGSNLWALNTLGTSNQACIE